MNHVLFFTLGIVLLVCGCKTAAHQQIDDTEKKPFNVLFIAVDDLRPELNFYGANHIHSPHLDRLSDESMIFDRAYCNIPVCGASRASILTGARPTRHRFINHKTRKDLDLPDAVSLPLLLKKNGYTTISNGKVYHHNNDDSSAWDDVWFPEGHVRDYQTEQNFKLNQRGSGKRGLPYECTSVPDTAYFDGKIAEKGIADLRRLKEDGRPFFLALGFLKPHLPFNAPQKYWDLYDRTQISLPANYRQPTTTPDIAFHKYGELRRYHSVPSQGDISDDMAKELIHGYYACVSYVDAQIGLVLDELRKLEMDQNTVVVVWGDHGWNLGNHKLWCKHVTFESSLRAPLVIKIPGKTYGQSTDAITEFIDIYPSLAELVGIEIPETVEGRSFIPLIEGEKSTKDWAICKYNDAVTLIKGELFYTEWINDEGVAYDRMLFDHSTDPLELDNLAQKVEHKENITELAKELRASWGEEFLK